MKKYLSSFFLIAFIIITAFAFSIPSIVSVNAQTMTISELVEFLITVGAIAPDKIVAARAMVATLNNSTTTATSITATSSLPYIQVLYPNGGESWDIDVDVPYTITWGSSHPVPVSISLVPTRGAVCNITTTPVTSINSNNTYKLKLKTAKCFNQITGSSTPLTDGSYKVRVSYVDGAGVTVKDESNAAFRILPVLIPSVKVTYPNGGESLVRNHEYTAKYSLKNVTVDDRGLIYLYLLDSNGNIAFNSHKLVTNPGIYDFKLPSSLTPGAYKIKFKLTTNERVEIEDTSDSSFWVSSFL